MGKSDTASASIGIKILLADLISQINETNFTLIKKMLYDGCIEDANDYYNEAYRNIMVYGEDKLPENYLEFNAYITDKFKENGSYYKSKFSRIVEPDISRGSLFEKYLLVPIKEILETEIWGYERYVINSASRQLDFDLSVSTEEYKEIKNFNIIFFISQNTG